MRDSVKLIKNRTNESIIVSYDTIYNRYHVNNLDSDQVTKLQNAIVTLLEDIKLSKIEGSSDNKKTFLDLNKQLDTTDEGIFLQKCSDCVLRGKY